MIEDTYMWTSRRRRRPASTDVAIGWYDKDTFERLPVGFDDADMVIARVRVEPRSP